jgi:serine/alanine adding enzyme
MLEIQELQPRDKAQWDAYAAGAPYTTTYHLSDWQSVMEQTFHIQTHFLWANDGGHIAGVLPLVAIRSPISGHYLTSLPGAVCADGEEVAGALIARAMALTKAERAKYLILRDSRQKWGVPELVTQNGHCTLVVELSEDPNDVWRSVNRRVRQSVNKAAAAGIEVQVGRELLDDFYPVYAEAMRNRGTPTQGIRFFRSVFEQFPDNYTLLVMRCNGRIVGGGFVAGFRDTLFATWGGMLREYYHLRPNYVLYWETLKYGCEQGYKRLDLGRSTWDSGAYKFKKQWRAEPQPLYHQVFLNGAPEPPAVGDQREDTRLYRLFGKVWARLPLPVTEILGPWLRKQVPFG